MATTNLSIKLSSDHLQKISKSSGDAALMELIWNALDADAKNIHIDFELTQFETISKITIQDDGHGITRNKIEEMFGTLGHSAKKNNSQSPEGRKLHGKEGKGRFKALSLGDLVIFKSTYQENDVLKSFNIALDKNNINSLVITEPELSSTSTTGITIEINNPVIEKTTFLQKGEIIAEIETKLAIYYFSYPNFNIFIQNEKLDFNSAIKNTLTLNIPLEEKSDNMLDSDFSLKIIEWSQNKKNSSESKKIHFCGNEGISYYELPLGLRGISLPVSAYIISDYIEQIHTEGNLFELNHNILKITSAAKELIKIYVRERIALYAKEYIHELKTENLYPYKPLTVEDDDVEKAKREVFDILALDIKNFMPKFDKQDKQHKKFTFSLIKEALETKPQALHNIFLQVLDLPEAKREELSNVLNDTPLISIIDTMKSVTDRLKIIHELKLLLFDRSISTNIKERKHLHKIVENETWLFGDDYALGASDVNLSNVLKAHLKCLDRDDFQEVIDGANNEILSENIPDICLFKQFNLGKAESYEHLVVELKRPSKTCGVTEINQVKRYAQAISKDIRFSKERVSWHVVLLVTKLTEEAEFETNQSDRPKGVILANKNLKISVINWRDLLDEASMRLDYMKKQLNFVLTAKNNKIDVLKAKYPDNLPDNI